MGAPCGTMESTWGGEASDWAREALRRQCVHSGGRDSLIRIEHHEEYRNGEANEGKTGIHDIATGIHGIAMCDHKADR
jgi:hypothetical protein